MPVLLRPPVRCGDLRLSAPIAKSGVLRALILSAIAGGGRIRLPGGLPLPDDVRNLTSALRALGVPIIEGAAALEILGPADRSITTPITIGIGDGAAPARFLLAFAATLARPVTVVGSEGLSRRPMAPLLDALGRLGASVRGGPGLPAVVCGPARGGLVRVDSELSSQYLSALLLVAPAFPEGVVASATGRTVSRAYLDLTVSTLSSFGVAVGEDGFVAGGVPVTKATVDAEADWSGAAVLLAAAPLLQTRVLVPGLGLASSQPDRAAVGILAALGVELRQEGPDVVASGTLGRGGRFDLGASPDLAPTIAALASFATSPTSLVGAAHLRVKESDRIRSVVSLLRAAGAGARALDDGIEVLGGLLSEPSIGARPRPVRSEGDHRIAMAAALLGTRIPLLLDDGNCVAKSFPGFFEQWPGAELLP